MSALAYNPARASLDPTTPEGIGTVSARALIVVAHADGANQLGNLGGGAPFADYSAYIASNQPLIVAKALVRNAIAAPAHWQPLTFLDASGVLRTQTFLLPYWGQLRPFALSNGAEFRPGPPAQPGTAAFADQVNEIVTLQAGLTEQQKVITDFWCGGTCMMSWHGHLVAVCPGRLSARPLYRGE
ncbi:hypothetical protein LP420_34500 [Massilia sp. B-10]|nr:hypothetical protein LP420_34500 [Massilia sp. B-10]